MFRLISLNVYTSAFTTPTEVFVNPEHIVGIRRVSPSATTNVHSYVDMSNQQFHTVAGTPEDIRRDILIQWAGPTRY